MMDFLVVVRKHELARDVVESAVLTKLSVLAMSPSQLYQHMGQLSEINSYATRHFTVWIKNHVVRIVTLGFIQEELYKVS